jgi:hypothetical protein
MNEVANESDQTDQEIAILRPQATALASQLRMTAFMAALVQAQQEMEPIARDMKNDTTRSKYASLAAVDKAIRPHYTKQGLALNPNMLPLPMKATTKSASVVPIIDLIRCQ